MNWTFEMLSRAKKKRTSEGRNDRFAQVDLASTNRHAPRLSRAVFDAEVAENAPAGAPVCRLSATDADRDAGPLTFAILSDAALDTFSVDADTGPSPFRFLVYFFGLPSFAFFNQKSTMSTHKRATAKPRAEIPITVSDAST